MLTPERIMELEQQSYVKGHRPVSTEDCWGDEKITYEPTEHFNMFMFARAIESEVRKQDDALIQQMLYVIEAWERGCEQGDYWRDRDDAITAARARLGES